MADTRTALGPLERVDGTWAIGDRSRPGGSWIEFRAEGLYRHGRGGDGESIPWSRIMLGVGVVIGRGHPNHGQYSLLGMLGNLRGPFSGRGGGHIDMTLRHPYENRELTFVRHARAYRLFDTVLLQEMLSQVVAADEAQRLGDPDWVEHLVGRLELLTPWPKGSRLSEAVEGAWRA
ncbi:hypothetical protein [Streptomyces sp. NPDC054838]